MKKFSIFFALFVFSLFEIFSNRIISPYQGTWANRQALVIDVSDGAECFYSFTSSNPLDSGFAYDGPVLIDVSGEVKLKVVCFKTSGEREDFEINYTVKENNEKVENENAKSFIDNVVSKGVYAISGGENVSIPNDLKFCIGDGEQPFLNGKNISISELNVLSRYVPCVISFEKVLYRFVFFILGGDAGTFAKLSLPFDISDWENVRFFDKSQIWHIDNENWRKADSDISYKIDRTVSHTIEWQSVEFEIGNPIQRFELPPKPSINTTYSIDGVRFSVNGDLRYRMEISDSGIEGELKENQGLYSQIVFDTFSGDELNSTAIFNLYCDGVFQGELSSSYKLDKKPPLPPVFLTDEKKYSKYARHSVNLEIQSEKDCDIFYSICEDDKKETPFTKYERPLILLSHGEKVVKYKVVCYATDSNGNVGQNAIYDVIVDEFNYFVDSNFDSDFRDGSSENPFNSFEEIYNVIQDCRYAHFYVKGELKIPSGENLFPCNCTISGEDSTKFVLQSDSFIKIRGSSFEVKNCIFEKQISDNTKNNLDESKRFFVLENSSASFEDSELIGNFALNGTAFTSLNSIIVMKNTGVTVQSSDYVCGISAISSKLMLEKSRFSAVSSTAVNFSLQDGTFELLNNECKVVCTLGRIAELTNSTAKLKENVFLSRIYGKRKNVNSIWKDEKTNIIEDISNEQKYF